MEKLMLGIPKGSLEQSTVELFAKGELFVFKKNNKKGMRRI